jgi:hypothetical protein
VRAAPAVSCAIVHKTNAHEHTGSAEAIRHSLRNGFNGFLRALPGDRAFLPPSPPRSLLLKNLTPASGRQDHTTSPSASTPIVYRRIRVHRILSRVRDDLEPPTVGQDGKSYSLICISEKQKYLCRGGWTGQSPTRSTDLPVRQLPPSAFALRASANTSPAMKSVHGGKADSATARTYFRKWTRSGHRRLRARPQAGDLPTIDFS